MSYPNALNTIKYRRTNDETSCDIAFSDTIGKEGMNELLGAIIQARVNTSSTLDTNSNPLDVSYLDKSSKSSDASDPITVGIHIASEMTASEVNGATYPHLNDLEKHVECGESTWIGIHAFYSSEFGDKYFTKELVKLSYLKRRKTESRANHFSREWKKAEKEYFKTINDSEFGFQQKAIDGIKKIILGDEISIEKKKRAGTSKSGKKTAAKSVIVQEFDIFGNAKQNIKSLEELINNKKANTTNDRIVVIAYYITKVLMIETFTEGNIEFAYKALQLPDRPGHLRQVINNIKNSKMWFKDISPGEWSLERIAEIFVEDKMPITE